MRPKSVKKSKNQKSRFFDNYKFYLLWVYQILWQTSQNWKSIIGKTFFCILKHFTKSKTVLGSICWYRGTKIFEIFENFENFQKFKFYFDHRKIFTDSILIIFDFLKSSRSETFISALFIPERTRHTTFPVPSSWWFFENPREQPYHGD